MIDEAAVWESVQKVLDPELKKSLVELHMVRNIQIDADNVRVTLALTTLIRPSPSLRPSPAPSWSW